MNGIVVSNTNQWSNWWRSVDNSYVHNIKVISSMVYSDGFDIAHSTNVKVDNIFVINADDCISVKAKSYCERECRNLEFTNLVLWPTTAGNGIEIGYDLSGDNVLQKDVYKRQVIYRVILYKDITLTDGDRVFDDEADISPYAAAAVKYMLNSGIITGNENNCVLPKNDSTRAEAAVAAAALLDRINAETAN